MARPLRVLIADDDRDLAEAMAGYVRECGHEPVATISGGGLEVIRRYGQFEPDVVLLDIMMPRFNGLTVCHALLSRDPDAKIVFVSGKVDGAHPFVIGAGAVACLGKPIERSKLEEILRGLEPRNG
ncbi:MAG TPA: response regulator [Chthoniobacteraceae bacterium]|nr:response regulator [Chthoniobacteraceae bacterium]